MAHAVDRFEDDPEPDTGERARSVASYNGEVAPETKKHEADIDNEESNMRIRRVHERTQELSRSEHLPQPADIFLCGVGYLRTHQQQEKEFEPGGDHG